MDDEAISVLKAQGHSEHQAGVGIGHERFAQAFVATWNKYGQWGNFVNHETGEVAVYNTTGGAIAIGGLAFASRCSTTPEYLIVAKRRRTTTTVGIFSKGSTTERAADIMQNADSETAAGFMTALMTLYETSGEQALA